MSRKCTVSAEMAEGEAQGEHELHEDGQGQEQGLGREAAVVDHEHQQDGQAEHEVREVREHGHDGQNLGGEEDLLDEVPARDQDARALEKRGAEPGPGQDPAEEEERERLHGRRVVSRT